MSDFVILLGVLLLYMCATIAVGCYLCYEHNALIRKVQKMEHDLDGTSYLLDQVIDYQVRDGEKIIMMEKKLNAGHSETQSDDVPMGGR